MSRKDPTTRAQEATPSDAILESISDGVFTVDRDWRITSFNRAAEIITGIPREEALAKPCSEVFRSSMCEADCALRSTIETGAPVINKHCFIVDAEGTRIPISVSTAVLRDGNGSIIGGAETFRDLSEVEALRAELKGRSRLGDIVSQSPLMQRIFAILPQIAASESPVLIEGDTGTGKELIARAIHDHSSRASGPFIALNCGALPDTLLESELFGHKAGAFTGAVRDKAGRFAVAKGGTLFLDEIGEVSPNLQVRLLRVLQEKRYDPVGSEKSESADVRVIAATNRSLKELVANHVFREDLYYRINVVDIQLPPLRKRKEDIPLLVDHFIDRFNHTQGRHIRGINPEALALLTRHDYPGNVRELENIVERAFVLCLGDQIDVAHLPADVFDHMPAPPLPAGNLASTKRLVETRAIIDALERNQYNRLAAAHELGMHKSTLFRKIRAYGIPLPDHDGRYRKP